MRALGSGTGSVSQAQRPCPASWPCSSSPRVDPLKAQRREESAITRMRVISSPVPTDAAGRGAGDTAVADAGGNDPVPVISQTVAGLAVPTAIVEPSCEATDQIWMSQGVSTPRGAHAG